MPPQGMAEYADNTVASHYAPMLLRYFAQNKCLPYNCVLQYPSLSPDTILYLAAIRTQIIQQELTR